ncbi:unnamed protein product, partial [Brassica napus]
SKCRWGNFIGLVVFPLVIRCEDDPLKYVRRAKATMDKKKISMEPLISYGIVKLIMKIFGESFLQAESLLSTVRSFNSDIFKCVGSKRSYKFF